MLDRRGLLLGLPGALIAARALAQPAPKVIGVLSPYASADAQATLTLFRQALRDLGYAEGRGFTLVERFAEGRHGRLPALAAELVKLRVDLIVANDVSRDDRGFEAETNAVTIVGASEDVDVPLQSKAGVASTILDQIEQLLAGRPTVPTRA